MYGDPTGGPGSGLGVITPGLAVTGTYLLGPTLLAIALIAAGLFLYRLGRVRPRTFD